MESRSCSSSFNKCPFVAKQSEAQSACKVPDVRLQLISFVEDLTDVLFSHLNLFLK